MAFRPKLRRVKLLNHRRKKSYETKLEAKIAAARVKSEIGQMIVTYPCWIGGPVHFHIGHPEKRFWETEMDVLKAKVADQANRLAALEQQANKPKLKLVKGGKR